MPRIIEMYSKFEIIRRLKKKESKRSISKELKISRKVINKIHKICIKNNWIDNDKLPTEEQISNNYLDTFKPKVHIFNSIKEEIEYWYFSKYTFIIITQLINNKLNSKYNEITVRRYIKNNFSKMPKAVIRRKYTKGEIAEVDFGYLGMMYDIDEKRKKKVWVFSMRFRYSRYTYRELVFTQKSKVFLNCHINAFEYFGGVPKKVVCDNLKSAVINAYFEDVDINTSYYKLAEHYDFLISPNLPAKPQHKGGVEKDMDYVKRNFYPILKENQKSKGRENIYYTDAVEELKKWTEEIDNKHKIKYVNKTPEELFEEEKKELNPYIIIRWDELKWYNVKVGVDWKVQINKAFYSVPYEYIGKIVRASQNSKEVNIYFNYKLISKHINAKKSWERVENITHGPKNYTKYLENNSENVKNWAKNIGKNVYDFCKIILERTGVNGLRPAKALCALSKKYGEDRLEDACQRALYYKMKTFKDVKNILIKELDKLSLKKDVLAGFTLPIHFNNYTRIQNMRHIINNKIFSIKNFLSY